jgi:hypothetical protein
MKLTELHPRWLGLTRPDSGEQVEFDCPACGPSHRLIVMLSNPLDGKPGAPWLGKLVKGLDGQEKITPVWQRYGAEFDTLTLVPSVVFPCWHGWVEDGQVIDVTEATHMLVQVVFTAAKEQVSDAKVIALSPRQVQELRDQKVIP